MKKKYDLVGSFPPKKVKEVDKILLSYLDALKISKEDERIKYIFDDPYCPDIRVIQGVYIIYKKSILELLEGRIPSIHSYEFTNANKKDLTISEEDIEYILEIAPVIALASETDDILSTYFIAGHPGEKLYSVFNLCLGYSRELEKEVYKESLQRFMNDIKIVEQIGLLEEIIESK